MRKKRNGRRKGRRNEGKGICCLRECVLSFTSLLFRYSGSVSCLHSLCDLFAAFALAFNHLLPPTLLFHSLHLFIRLSVVFVSAHFSQDALFLPYQVKPANSPDVTPTLQSKFAHAMQSVGVWLRTCSHS